MEHTPDTERLLAQAREEVAEDYAEQCRIVLPADGRLHIVDLPTANAAEVTQINRLMGFSAEESANLALLNEIGIDPKTNDTWPIERLVTDCDLSYAKRRAINIRLLQQTSPQ